MMDSRTFTAKIRTAYHESVYSIEFAKWAEEVILQYETELNDASK
jgi:DNA-dependent RNA polymerase auxiliary subunit epsilon